MYTGAQLKALGKRLRDGNADEADLGVLNDLRGELDALLLTTAAHATTCLVGTPAVMAGRAKRLRSVIRKLQRPANHGMDLSRMEDLVGLRIVVPDALHQQTVIDRLDAGLAIRRIHDYRDQQREYRAVHVVAHDGPRLIEIQVRTIPQQLWANESESFGEAVKEGNGTADIREYLRELSTACCTLDQDPTHHHTTLLPLMRARQALSVRLPVLRALHERAANCLRDANNAYVVVYDGVMNQCTQVLPYLPADRAKALEDYTRMSGNLPDDRYEVLILNAASEHLVQVTHGRFFPEGVPPTFALGRSPGT